MKLTRLTLIVVTVFAVCVFFDSLAHAQATRTWVSGVGDDVNPCSRTAPCKTFAGAISKTAPGGEINCLDPGGFGAVTITKAITIECLHTVGGVLAALVNRVIVNAAATGGLVNAVIEKTTVENQAYGLAAGANTRVTTRGSVYSGNSNGGIVAQGGGSVNVGSCIVTNNGVGLYSGADGTISVASSFLSGNNTGVATAGSGIAATFFDNKFQGTSAGAFNLGLTKN